MIILDFGSGETCKNDLQYVERMIDSLVAVDSGKHEIVIKWQLFSGAWYEKERRELIRLTPRTFQHAYYYAERYGYKTTASVFDRETLSYLLGFDVPFIKVANKLSLHYLVPTILKNGRDVVISVSSKNMYSLVRAEYGDIKVMCCVSEYPAAGVDYQDKFGDLLHEGFSDHTVDFDLYERYWPDLYECHYKLEDSTGPDAGLYARTPEQLKAIL
jgi:sialic acid synthase SpsE